MIVYLLKSSLWYLILFKRFILLLDFLLNNARVFILLFLIIYYENKKYNRGYGVVLGKPKSIRSKTTGRK